MYYLLLVHKHVVIVIFNYDEFVLTTIVFEFLDFNILLNKPKERHSFYFLMMIFICFP